MVYIRISQLIRIYVHVRIYRICDIFYTFVKRHRVYLQRGLIIRGGFIIN